MTLEHRSYSHAVTPRGVGYYVARLVFLWVLGFLGMLIVEAMLITAILRPGSDMRGNQLSKLDIFQNVAIEGVRSTVSPWWKSAPWPDGGVLARIQSRMPIAADPLMLHAAIQAVVFAVLGFMAGRMQMINPGLLLPGLLFVATYGLMKSNLLPLTPFNWVSVFLVLGVQLGCLYGCALWGKWSSRQ